MRILVVRLGALGDFVLSFGPFAAIRAHHPQAEITLLTTAPFADLARAAPWFDKVIIDRRPSWWQIGGVLALRRSLAGFDMVYDLQTSQRSARYFQLAGRPDWSGIAPGCRFPDPQPNRNQLHTIERQRGQLQGAGITEFPAPALEWLTEPADIDLFELGLPNHFGLLVPGAAPHRPAKRWPSAEFAQLAKLMTGQWMVPVIVGGQVDGILGEVIRAVCPQAVDLTGKTSLRQLAAVCARAALAVGNDTGPMHLAAAVGVRSLVLFSDESDPDLTAPRGLTEGQVEVLRSPRLADLPAARVAAMLGWP